MVMLPMVDPPAFSAEHTISFCPRRISRLASTPMISTPLPFGKFKIEKDELFKSPIADASCSPTSLNCQVTSALGFPLTLQANTNSFTAWTSKAPLAPCLLGQNRLWFLCGTKGYHPALRCGATAKRQR